MDHLVKYPLDLAQACLSDNDEGKEVEEVVMGLFTGVTNTPQVLAHVQAYGGCLINPSLALDERHVLVAINRALCAQRGDKLRTKSLYSEVLYSMSASKNIEDALKRFGTKPSDQSFIALTIDKNPEARDRFFSLISGQNVPLSQLKDSISDMDQIKQIFKTGTCDSFPAIWDLVVSKIATKEFVR
jgi:EKC/KEOPS complex subunit CGI121/TPRKB